MSSSDLIASISLEGLVAARDEALLAFKEANTILQRAKKSLDRFGVSFPDVKLSHYGGNSRELSELVEDPKERGFLERMLDQASWKSLFRKTNIDQIMDQKTRDEFNAKLSYDSFGYHGDGGGGMPPLTEDNIRATMQGVYEDRGEYFAKAVEAVYKRLSWDYKTNQPYQFGQKIIVSYAVCSYSHFNSEDEMSLYAVSTSILDLERVVNTLAKRQPSNSDTGVRGMKAVKRGVWTDVPALEGDPLMRIKLYKNRNAHVEIYDEEIVNGMNRIMSERVPFALKKGAENG